LINPQELYDTIDNYLNGTLPEQERIDFEKKVSQDESLAAKVAETKATNEAIYFASLAELKLTIGQDIKKIKYKPAPNWRKASYILIAATTLISGVAIYIIKDNENPDGPKTESKNVKNNSEQENHYLNSGEPQKIEKKFPTNSIQNNKEAQNTISSSNKSSVESNLTDSPIRENLEETKNVSTENKVFPIDNNVSIKNSEKHSSSESETLCDKSFKINSEASCKNQETGSIVILTDGFKEYVFQINNHTSSGSKGVFHNLQPGAYEVLITYNKECSYTKSVTVGEKWCPMNSPFSFNPDYNEKWIIKYEHETSGRFTIFDTRGKEIYNSAFGSGNEYWNGTDMYGSVVPIGVYIGMINYSDGRQEKVELTIIR
jgi:hypothetical protein